MSDVDNNQAVFSTPFFLNFRTVSLQIGGTRVNITTNLGGKEHKKYFEPLKFYAERYPPNYGEADSVLGVLLAQELTEVEE